MMAENSNTNFVFVDENDDNISNICFIDVGDKIINRNGEWVCVGKINDVRTEIIPVRKSLFGHKEYEQRKEIVQKTYIMRRIKTKLMNL